MGLPGRVQADSAALHREALVQQPLAAQRKGGLFRSPGGIARGEMLVVQNPDPHAPLFGLVQQNGHIPPPGLPAKALVGPGLHAERPDVGVIDGPHHLAVYFFALAVYPQEGQNAGIVMVRHRQVPPFIME